MTKIIRVNKKADSYRDERCCGFVHFRAQHVDNIFPGVTGNGFHLICQIIRDMQLDRRHAAKLRHISSENNCLFICRMELAASVE
jgi:hypothetical protein